MESTFLLKVEVLRILNFSDSAVQMSNNEHLVNSNVADVAGGHLNSVDSTIYSHVHILLRSCKPAPNMAQGGRRRNRYQHQYHMSMDITPMSDVTTQQRYPSIPK